MEQDPWLEGPVFVWEAGFWVLIRGLFEMIGSFLRLVAAFCGG